MKKKEYTLRTITESGDVVGESKITLEEGTILIQSVPNDVTTETVVFMHNRLAESLERNTDLITIPFGIKLQVLEVK